MAMLAEPRRKQKFSADPRNLNWSNDETKFGHKMLEKMGWSKGKGLGASEQGEVDHITVKVKNDAKGVGCSKKYADTWIAHQDDFNSLLANLNAGHSGSGTNTPDSDKVASLENSSRASKSRVHYGKFTRGKDLSTRGADELECIFGKKKKAEADASNAEKEQNRDAPETDTAPDDDSNLITSTQSVADYFAQKMAALQRLRNNGAAAESGANESAGDNIDEDQRTSDSHVEKTAEIIEEGDKDSSEDGKLKKKKKKKKKRAIEEGENDTVADCNVKEKSCEKVEIEDDQVSEMPAKKKKKKCKKMHKSEKKDVDDSSVDCVGKLDDGNSDDIIDSSEITKKKKSKKKRKNDEDDNEVSEPKKVKIDESDIPDEKVKSKKSKKQQKKQKESGTSSRYVINKKTGEKVFIDDLKLDEKFKGSNVTEVGPYGKFK